MSPKRQWKRKGRKRKEHRGNWGGNGGRAFWWGFVIGVLLPAQEMGTSAHADSVFCSPLLLVTCLVPRDWVLSACQSSERKLTLNSTCFVPSNPLPFRWWTLSPWSTLFCKSKHLESSLAAGICRICDLELCVKGELSDPELPVSGNTREI